METETKFTTLKNALIHPIGGSAIAGFIFIIIGMSSGVLIEDKAVMIFFVIGSLGFLAFSISATVLYLLYKILVNSARSSTHLVEHCCCAKRKKLQQDQSRNIWIEKWNDSFIAYTVSSDETGLSDSAYNSKGQLLY
jgi:hypothetical protein